MWFAADASKGVPDLQATSVSSYAGLLAAVRERLRELQLTYEVVEDLAGTQTGYVVKVIGPHPSRGLGPVSWNILSALALKITISVDDEAAAKLRPRWTPRRSALPSSRAAGDAAYSGWAADHG
jgi:hypothetical protein